MSVAVSISDRAENDLINQYRWYADNASEEIAERFLAAFQQTTDSLARMPQLGRLRWFRAPELFDMRSFALGKPFESHLVSTRQLQSFVVQQLGLAIVGKRNAVLGEASVIIADVTESIGIDVDGRRVDLQALVTGDEVIIGQTVLEMIDMLPDCMNQRLVPNPAHPDQPIIKLK